MVNNWLKIIQRNLIPPRCVLCGDTGFADLDLCAGCLGDLPRNLCCCYRCGEPFASELALPSLCGRCLKRSPQFDETYAPYLYRYQMPYLIGQLKFGRDYKNARLLAMLLGEHIAAGAELPELLLPMPLHPKRYRERGFNQSIEIARHLARRFDIPLDLYSAVRSRDTLHQAGLPAKQRLKNMRGAFRLQKTLQADHVAIVDDVMTTGATVSALAGVLKQAGVGRVDVWVCARA
ncbi:ComF family protein [Methylomonas koyamae]|uniref:ComF family protein n=1 Tax=Methylomonas koyamae TaxID=702114 RepID=UPI001C32B589|nr:ComF family protein [Methylomonas koyamae]BBL59140.1 amidophosphoribosyltransferase [Methylomonas koyamae]